jgi:hypothetical protein
MRRHLRLPRHLSIIIIIIIVIVVVVVIALGAHVRVHDSIPVDFPLSSIIITRRHTLRHFCISIITVVTVIIITIIIIVIIIVVVVVVVFVCSFSAP